MMILMFNDRLMIEKYLDNKYVNPKALGDIIHLLCKHYIHEQGMDCIQAKQQILQWLETNDLYFNGDINKAVIEAGKDKKPLKEKEPIWINSEDIRIIKETVYTKNSRKVALFLLCYAKMYADRDRIFSIRISTMAKWIGIDKSNLYGRYIKELIDFGYIKPLEEKQARILKYFGKQQERDYQLQFMHPLINCGSIELSDYDIDAVSKILFN